MFETSLGLGLTPWALNESEKVDKDYYKCWLPLKKHFNPSERWNLKTCMPNNECSMCIVHVLIIIFLRFSEDDGASPPKKMRSAKK